MVPRDPGSEPPILVAEALLERIYRMRKEIPGVRESEDIEFVHRLRVGSRRLRTALAIFEDALPQDKYRSWRKSIRRITKALGAVRDLDVQINFLLHFLKRIEGTSKKKGVNRLLLRLRQARSAALAQARSALDRLERKGVLNEMEREMRRFAVGARAADQNGGKRALLQQARASINLGLDDFLSFEFYIGREEPAAELHDMRIAAKRLRYTMEVFAPLYDESFGDLVKSVHRAQTLLGNLHDADILLERLPSFLDRESERTKEHLGHLRGFGRLKLGITAVEKDRLNERDKLYREFLDFWMEHREKKTWNTLRQALAPHPMPEEEEPATQSDSPA